MPVLPKRSAPRRILLGVAAALLLAATHAQAQPPVHYQNGGALPPGAIGSQQLLRGGPLPGYVQPVEIQAPDGARLSLAVANGFEESQPTPLTVGLIIAPVYRLRVTNIPQRPGLEVYPTIEVVNRLYPPVGMEGRFPVPIQLTAEDLDLALEGKFVTRVVYLENPHDALPVSEDPLRQTWFEVTPGENPLEVADRLGRPMAIVRMGGRVPDANGPDAAFLFSSPPFIRYRLPSEIRALEGPPAGATDDAGPNQP